MRLVELVSIDCIVYRQGLFELNCYYQNQINRALLSAARGLFRSWAIWVKSPSVSPGPSDKAARNRNFLILVFLTGNMGFGVFLIFQRKSDRGIFL